MFILRLHLISMLMIVLKILAVFKIFLNKKKNDKKAVKKNLHKKSITKWVLKIQEKKFQMYWAKNSETNGLNNFLNLNTKIKKKFNLIMHYENRAKKNKKLKGIKNE